MARKPTTPELSPAQIKSLARRERAARLATDPARRPIPASGGSWIEQADGTLIRDPAELPATPAEPAEKEG